MRNKPQKSPSGQEEKTNGPEDKLIDFSSLVMDDRHPLTARQCFKLVQSWRAIKRNMAFTGVEMFVR
nr:hypothetical protein BaRGS_012534 [Batillaria attramentaria]